MADNPITGPGIHAAVAHAHAHAAVPGTTVLGYPRIGPRCELRSATEDYRAGRLDAGGLLEVGARLRGSVWTDLRAAGLGQIPSNTFSFHDHLLDAAVLVDAVPERLRHLDGLDAYFAMAHGADGVPGLETNEWFGTGYQHVVPEVGPGTRFRLAAAGRAKPLAEYLEARALGVETRPVLVGPLTFLLLAASPAGFRPLDLLDDLIEVYAELLERLSGAGASWVQFDEPALACDRDSRELAALGHAYRRLAALPSRPRLLVSTGFGEIGDALPVLASTQVEAIGLDFVAGPGNLEALASIGGLPLRTLVAGVVDGRNVWRTDPRQALATCASLLGLAGEVTVSTSCSLLHVPLDLDAEPDLDPALRARLSFARQKVDEVVALGRALRQERPATPPHTAATTSPAVPDIHAVARLYAPDHRVRARLDALGDGRPRAEWAVRSAAQRRAFYLSWATGVFRLATSGIADTTQIHTHICQSWSQDVLAAIGALDADVTSVESARPRTGPLSGPRAALFRGGVGPGVYDSRSHRVPGVEEMAGALRHLLRSVGPDRLWVNPDCGLRTREPAEIEAALRNMVAAAVHVRTTLPTTLDQASGGR